MRNLLIPCILILAAVQCSGQASAADWMFRSSYYSHMPAAAQAAPDGRVPVMPEPTFAQPAPRSAYRAAIPQCPPGHRPVLERNIQRALPKWPGSIFLRGRGC